MRFPRTSRILLSTCFVIAWCCRTRPWPTTSAPTAFSPGSSLRCPFPTCRCANHESLTMTPSSVQTPERLLRRLEWRVIRRLDGRLQGDYRTMFRGTGIDVADLREYQPGDDLRHVDWNVTARMDTPYVREYLEDREVTGWLLLDRSASMAFGPVERRKHVVLTEVAATVAQLLTRGGNRIGAVLFDTTVQETIPPRGGRPQVLRILSRLMREPAPAAGKARITDLNVPLRAALGIVRRRSLIVVVSDFLSEPGWE